MITQSELEMVEMLTGFLIGFFVMFLLSIVKEHVEDADELLQRYRERVARDEFRKKLNEIRKASSAPNEEQQP